MVGKKARFTPNQGRIDPYKNFNFRLVITTAVAAIAGLGLVKKLFGASASKRKSKDYLTPTPIKEPPRPINSVGISTARGFTARSKAKRVGNASSSRGRKGASTRKTGKPKSR